METETQTNDQLAEMIYNMGDTYEPLELLAIVANWDDEEWAQLTWERTLTRADRLDVVARLAIKIRDYDGK